MVWNELQQAKLAMASLKKKDLTVDTRRGLNALLLAGGGDEEDLPPGLAEALHAFEQIPPDVRKSCLNVKRHLIAVALECSRQAAFKQRISSVFAAMDIEHGSAPAICNIPKAANHGEHAQNRTLFAGQAASPVMDIEHGERAQNRTSVGWDSPVSSEVTSISSVSTSSISSVF